MKTTTILILAAIALYFYTKNKQPQSNAALPAYIPNNFGDVQSKLPNEKFFNG